MDQENQEAAGGIDVGSIVSASTGKPFVQFTATQLQWQMTPDEARTWAQVILEAAESADQDAFLVDWLTSRLDVERGPAAQILGEYREYRESKRNEEEGRVPPSGWAVRPRAGRPCPCPGWATVPMPEPSHPPEPL